MIEQVRVVGYQQTVGKGITTTDFHFIKQKDPHFLCLPEFFFPPLDSKGRITDYKENLDTLKAYSLELNAVVIGGTMAYPEDGKIYNTCFVYHKGKEITQYKKIHLYEPEKKWATPGDEYVSFTWNGIRIGLLICADVLYKESFEAMKKQKVKIIFTPTFSPYKPGETASVKYERDQRLYLNNAKYCQSFIVKVCSKGLFNGRRSQGRSLIASPNRFLFKVPPFRENHKQIIVANLDLTELQ